MRTRVKFCGITHREDALAAIHHGADAIGLVFYPKSPRFVTISQAIEITQTLPPFISIVGLFVNAQEQEIKDVLHAVPIDTIQFHGDESPAQCNCYNKPYIKAISMKEGISLPQMAETYQEAAALLLDTYQQGTPGGTGQTFNWDKIPLDLTKEIILAGGLTPENVAQGIRQVKPYGVDVSGGIERSKGIKDTVKMAAFMKGVANADSR
ncbi:phosphoribosylanthranilate isomerase [Candidatus Nitrosacidococcus sp. I8]|uniref:phosphoribosylanthranilate isomerase n=1 Tax=Candidatus Nitrosacidococcus sp. I8 TaxID=2942908 RepID=UPI002227F884|nr:phosphoribosylanthranilate isomerase [Candidatus Nitrosacidococcus sp. I8]CAH9018745.1 N-(5'-phosphoribosyl)anthranilate isomerase [Candidatus Nitrosacidococcus sp. I8]